MVYPVNFHKVSDILYRSGQPHKDEFKTIESIGVRSIVNLRSFHSDRKLLEDTNLKYHHIFMKAWHPEKEDAVNFLRFLLVPENQPVLVHCQHGSDRTGCMVALYRVCVEGWERQQAVNEMLKAEYRFHAIWGNLVYWLSRVDIDSIKLAIGV